MCRPACSQVLLDAPWFASSLLAALLLAAPLSAAEIRAKGALNVPPGAALTVVSTDPVVHTVLEEDVAAAKRSPAVETSKVLTLTVTLNQHLLAPGVSLKDLSPGEPDVVELLTDAGAEPPALTDTGTTETNPYERAARLEAERPGTPLSQLQSANDPFRSLGAYPGYSPHDPSPYDNIPKSTIYDSAIVCHAELSEGRGALTTVAVFHPNEDPRAIKKLIAERIAQQLLH